MCDREREGRGMMEGQNPRKTGEGRVQVGEVAFSRRCGFLFVVGGTLRRIGSDAYVHTWR